MPTRVLIRGIGMTDFGTVPNRTAATMVREAVGRALADADLRAVDVGMVFLANAFAGTMHGQESVRGQAWLDGTELAGVPLVNIENACAGGSSALALARTAVAAGDVETALVVGTEQLTHADRRRAVRAMIGAMAQDRLPELRREFGLDDDSSPFMHVYARYADEYAASSGATAEDFARVAAKNRAHGAANPRAQVREAISVEQVMAGRPVVGALTVPMCAPIGDGAAAVVVSSAPSPRSVELRSCVVGAGVRGRAEQVVADTAKRAFHRAGVAPGDVDVVEVHDAASPAELIALEQLGLAEHGEAVALVRAGKTSIGGSLPTNPSGGLISRGHPLGATGAAQIVELVEQLRGESGTRQVDGARVAVAENAGGYLGPEPAAVTVSVLVR